jgi:hypothetical protein
MELAVTPVSDAPFGPAGAATPPGVGAAGPGPAVAPGVAAGAVADPPAAGPAPWARPAAEAAARAGAVEAVPRAAPVDVPGADELRPGAAAAIVVWVSDSKAAPPSTGAAALTAVCPGAGVLAMAALRVATTSLLAPQAAAVKATVTAAAQRTAWEVHIVVLLRVSIRPRPDQDGLAR